MTGHLHLLGYSVLETEIGVDTLTFVSPLLNGTLQSIFGYSRDSFNSGGPDLRHLPNSENLGKALSLSLLSLYTSSASSPLRVRCLPMSQLIFQPWTAIDWPGRHHDGCHLLANQQWVHRRSTAVCFLQHIPYLFVRIFCPLFRML